ncbi:hypothetical protein XELAEV_18017493mg [Xenopus laevis]|uniref:Uncharacterized protein n=1 Tax=Xenopus laevis TaxID=8355 RepID=A0A974HSW9_XENLA|nr:hypothetical protein XELAEV_18017493mg [Xenopus laevis]
MNELWDMDARILKANSVLNTDIDTSSDYSNASWIFRDFEHKLTKELHIWWEIASLEKYVTSQMIPRGLRIKKLPSVFDRDEARFCGWFPCWLFSYFFSIRSEKAKDVFLGEHHFLKKAHTAAGQWTQKNTNRELWKRQPEEQTREQEDKNQYVLRKKHPKKY